eukprot:8799368-Heterocapsa_arctica.AAC.1
MIHLNRLAHTLWRTISVSSGSQRHIICFEFACWPVALGVLPTGTTMVSCSSKEKNFMMAGSWVADTKINTLIYALLFKAGCALTSACTSCAQSSRYLIYRFGTTSLNERDKPVFQTKPDAKSFRSANAFFAKASKPSLCMERSCASAEQHPDTCQ